MATTNISGGICFLHDEKAALSFLASRRTGVVIYSHKMWYYKEWKEVEDRELDLVDYSMAVDPQSFVETMPEYCEDVVEAVVGV